MADAGPSTVPAPAPAPEPAPADSLEATPTPSLSLADDDALDSKASTPLPPSLPELPPSLTHPQAPIRRIPLYLAPRLAPSLHLLQFPVHTRPLRTPANAKSAISARWKKGVRRLEVEVPLDTRPVVWNREKAEELGKGWEEEGRKERGEGAGKPGGRGRRKRDAEVEDEKTPVLDRQKLDSTVVPQQTNYFVGVMKDGALHLTPLHHTLQLRPSLTYLDALDTLSKERKRAEAADASSDAEDEATTNGKGKAPAAQDTGRVVQVQAMASAGAGAFNAPQSAGGPRNPILAPLRKDEDEPFVAFGWRGFESAEAERVYADMFARKQEALKCGMEAREYLGL